MRRHALRAWLLCWLMLVWVLLWGSASVANVVGGLVIAVGVIVLLPLPVVPVEGRVHPLSLLRLIAVVSHELIASSAQMAWLAIRPGPPPRTAVLQAQLTVKSDLVLALAVNIITIIPGSIVLEIDQERRLIFVHVIDVGSDEAIAHFHSHVAQIERLLVAAFERERDWKPFASEETS
jgi:multicomponent Na+:H+ antiporter subunit E